MCPPPVRLWLLAGLFVLLSTAVSAELVGMTPRSGGVVAPGLACLGAACAPSDAGSMASAPSQLQS